MFNDAIFAVFAVDDNLTLTDAKSKLVSIRSLTEGSASAILDSIFLCYCSTMNYVLRKCDACLKDFALLSDLARDLRIRPVNLSGIFDNAIGAVRQRVVQGGHTFTLPLTKRSFHSAQSTGAKRRSDGSGGKGKGKGKPSAAKYD